MYIELTMTSAIQIVLSNKCGLQAQELSVKIVQTRDKGWNMAEEHKLLNLLETTLWILTTEPSE